MGGEVQRGVVLKWHSNLDLKSVWKREHRRVRTTLNRATHEMRRKKNLLLQIPKPLFYKDDPSPGNPYVQPSSNL